MKTIKHKLIAALLLCTTVAFSQTRTQKQTESFNVKEDVIVEINAHNSDVVVEHWNKNEVLVETVLSVDGVTVEESKELFDNWKIEALGNSNKVVVNSYPDFHFNAAYHFDIDMPEMDFDIPEMDFDFEPVIAFALKFDSLSYPAPPEMPAVAVKVLQQIEWDQEAYEKDKDKYLKEWESKQQEWEKEIEEKYEPMMEEYEKEMEKWEKEFAEKYEPKIKEYEKEMEKWEKEFEEKYEPKMKEFEKKMALKEKEIEKQAAELEAKLEKQMKKTKKVKKKITIKVPKKARLDVHKDKEGSIKLPKDAKTI